MYLSQLSDSDWQSMADGIESISKDWTEDDLYENMGNALHDLGYQVSQSNNNSILESKTASADEMFNVEKAVNYVSNTNALNEDEAKTKGRKFWTRMKEKLHYAICNTPALKDLIEGNGTLKDKLKILVPIILTGIGVAALNPILLALICAAIALILKTTFEAYCEV